MSNTTEEREIYVRFVWVNGRRLGIVIDKTVKPKMDLFNMAPYIAQMIFVDRLLMIDYRKIWTYWDKQVENQKLVITHKPSNTEIPAPTMEIAIQVAKKRYISESGTSK